MTIPSLRKIASAAQVNTSTVQHAMISLVHEGLVEKNTGKGYSVIKDQEKIIYRRQELVQYTTKRFLDAMKALGYDRQQIIEAVSQYFHDNSNYDFENQI